MVGVNGKIVKSPEYKIDPDKDNVTLNQKPISTNTHTYIMLNKPTGVVSATEDREQTTVIDIIPEGLKKRDLFPAGRLDKDTTGFVLITDDGQFAHNILSPAHHVTKTYVAVTDMPANQSTIDFFKKGITLKNGDKCMSAELEIIQDTTNRVIIKEGMYHQIKRMFAACGLKVVSLHRTAIGGLELDPDLQPGEALLLDTGDLDKILAKSR